MPKSSGDPKTPITVVCPNAQEVPGEGLPRIAAYLQDGKLTDIPNDVSTLHENFLRGIKLSGNGPFLGRREKYANGNVGPYLWENYEAVLTRCKHFGSGLCEHISPKDPVGIYATNRPEWTVTEQACYMFNFNTVPLYDTLGIDAIQFIIEQTEMKLIVTSGDKVAHLLDLQEKLPTLRVIVTMDPVTTEDLTKRAEKTGIQIILFQNIEKNGQASPKTPTLPTTDDLATICYTSGTTGLPKGVMLTHRNFLAVTYALMVSSKHHYFTSLSHQDIHISYLPLAHVFERAIHQVLVYNGARIGFFQGDTLKLLQDVTELRPTLFISVPRLFNRIYDRVWAGVREKGGVAASLFQMAYNAKKSSLKKGQVTHWLWDRLVFGNVREKLGGRVRFLFTGSAPISPDVMDFLRICFSCDVYQGYGQTETAAGISFTALGDTMSGHLGAPLPCNMVKLVDVPTMQYTSKDTPFPRGEIYVKGGSVFVGYYKAPEMTAATLLDDGWCATGDIGLWDAAGRLVIVDRVKHIFKLAQGEYIAPEKIEGVYAQHELIQQCFIYGSSLKAALIAVFVLDPDALVKASLRREDEDFLPKLCLLLATYGKKAGLKGFEIVKAALIADEPFSVENGLLTPTFKLKRREIQAVYQEKLDALYTKIE